MDRTIVTVGEIPAAEDFLSVQREGMRDAGRLAQALTGGNPVVDGLPCTPTQPASMSVLLGAGTCYWPTVVDGTPFGVLAADLNPTMKIGRYDGETLPLGAPPAAGTDLVFLIQCTFTEPDTEAAVLAFYNGADPSRPFSGPGNSGAQTFKKRVARCAVSAKAGAPAPTGTASAPAADPGYVPLWLVTIPHGAASITSSMIQAAPGAPRFSSRLVGGASAADLAAEAAARAQGDAGLNSALAAAVAALSAALQAETDSRSLAVATEAMARAAIRPGTIAMAVYNASDTFVVPPGITRVRVTVTGGGGGGGSASSSTAGGGGGAAGTATGWFAVSPGQQIPMTLGTGGIGGTGGGNGGSGTTTSFGGYISASGGGGGAGGNASSAGGAAGAGYGGQLTLVGGLGRDGSNTSLASGGDGGSSYWGGGGRAAATQDSSAPQLGEAYGSGGGGGYFYAGAQGGPGQVGVVVIDY